MNTFMEIKSYKTLAQFKAKISHNGRKKSLDKESRDKPFLNQINDNRHLLDDIKKNKNNRTKTEISKDISRFKYKLGRTKKEKTKAKYEEKIKELELEHKLFTDKRTTAKNSFYDFVFSLTDVKKQLKQDLKYGKDLEQTVLEYFKSKFPNAQIVLNALHMDQSNPHMHISAQYPQISGISLTADLNKSFGDTKFHYQNMQLDFNSYIKNSDLVKNHNLKIEDITKGGKKEYLKLGAYKALEETFKEKSINDVQNLINGYKDKKMDNNAIFKALKQQLTITHQKHLAAKDYIYKSEKNRNVMELKFNKKIETLEDEVNKYKNGGKRLKNELDKQRDTYNTLNDDFKALEEEFNHLDDYAYKLEKKLSKVDSYINIQIEKATKSLKLKLEQSKKERIYALEKLNDLENQLSEFKNSEINGFS